MSLGGAAVVGEQASSHSLASNLSGQAVILAELVQLALEPMLAEEGLSVATFDMLSAIQSGNGEFTQAQVAGTLRVSAPTLSEAVKAAVEHGLVIQREDPTDRRTRRLALTARSTAILGRAIQIMDEVERSLRSDMSPGELEVVLRVIPRAIQKLAQHVRAVGTVRGRSAP